MKGFLILCLSFITLISTTDFYISVDRLMTPNVCSNGMIVLHAEVDLPLSNLNVYLNSFNITITKKNTDKEEKSKLWCFIQQLKKDGKNAHIGCMTKRLAEGEYSIDKQEKITFSIGKHQFTINEFTIRDTFKVKAGEENYFNEPSGEQELIFSAQDRKENLIYYLFEKISAKNIYIHLFIDYNQKARIKCDVILRQVICPVNAGDLPSKNNNEYEVYVEDSNGELKKNYFANKVKVTFT